MDGVSSVKVQARQDGRHSGGCPVDSKLCFPSSQVTRIKRRVIRMYVAVITFEANQWKFCLLFASHLYMPNVDAVLFLTVGRFAAASLLSCFFFLMKSSAELKHCCLLLPYPCATFTHAFLVFAAYQAVRCQVLDYFFRQREVLREDHILFSFEQSMVFSKAEFGLIDQVSVTLIGHISQRSESETMADAPTLLQ